MKERSQQSAFSLVEVTLALAIAAVAMVTILAMVPQAMESSRSSADRTAVGAVLEDVQEQIRGLVLEIGIPDESPLFYDVQGRPLVFDPDDRTSDSSEPDPFFRIDIELVEMLEPAPPKHAEDLLAASVMLTWPLTETGEPRNSAGPQLRFSRPITTLTGPDWQTIDPEYLPKVEH